MSRGALSGQGLLQLQAAGPGALRGSQLAEVGDTSSQTAGGAARELSERAEARLLAAVGGLEVFSVLSLRGSVFVHFWSGSVQSLVRCSSRWSSLAVQS